MKKIKNDIIDLQAKEAAGGFEAAGTVIAGLLAIPDIPISKVAIGVAISSASIIYGYIVVCNGAESTYKVIKSRLDTLSIKHILGRIFYEN